MALVIRLDPLRDAPGLVTDTETVGRSMFGSRSTPSPMNE
jgi:hypothetical protein